MPKFEEVNIIAYYNVMITTQLYDLNVILTLIKLQPSFNIHIYFANHMKLLLILEFYDVRPTCDLLPVEVMVVAFCGD